MKDYRDDITLKRWYRTESCWNCEQNDRLTQPEQMYPFRIRARKR